MSPKHGDDGAEPAQSKDGPSQHNMATGRCDNPTIASQNSQADDWEEWEDDDVITLIDVGAQSPTDNAKRSSTDTGCCSLYSIDTTCSHAGSCAETCAEILSTHVNTQTYLPAPPTASASVHLRSSEQVSAMASRQSVGRISRPRSKRRQKTQNPKFGIRLITDMTKFRRPNHMANQMRSPATRAPKFVDAAALRALEGSPNLESVANWNWLKKNKNQKQVIASPRQVARSPDEDLSPEDGPIVIGIALPPEEAAGHGIVPLIATVNALLTPADRLNSFSDTDQPKSVWSPNTPDTASSFGSIRRASSVYSHVTMPDIGLGSSNSGVPPVPAVPANYRKISQHRLISLELGRSAHDDEDAATPCTLFEEDGTAPLKSPMAKLSAVTPDSAGSRSLGWWDHHVVTPFLDKRMSFANRKQKAESSTEEQVSRLEKDAKDKQERARLSPSKEKTDEQLCESVPKTARECMSTTSVEKLGWQAPTLQQTSPSRLNAPTPGVLRANPERPTTALNGSNVQKHQQPFVVDRVEMNSAPTLRIPTPRRMSSPRAYAPGTEASHEPLERCVPAPNQLGILEKPQIWVTEDFPVDHPPPYSPPKKQLEALVRYQAVLPPDHHPNENLGSSQGLSQSTSPLVLASTMTSQAAARRMDDPGAAQSRTDMQSPQPAYQTQQTARFVQEGDTNRTPTPNRPGAAFLSVEDIRESPRVTQPSRTNKPEGHAQSGQLPVLVGGPYVPEQQSRFSVSPTSSTGSCLSDEHTRGVQRHIRPVGSFVMAPFLSHKWGASPSGEQRRLAAPCRAWPAEPHPEGQYIDPARVYLPSEQHSGPVNWSGGAASPKEYGYAEPLPARPAGTYLPKEHARAAPGRGQKIERERRRHEKEEVLARRIGGFWRGRGCMPTKGCFGRAGREGRQKRRIWMGVTGAMIALMILAAVLAVVLARHHGTHEPHSIWVNLTDFPPMPTGVLTVVGPDNTVAKSGCTKPSTLWSCSLPRDDQDSVAPYKPNQPTVVFQIQWDNSTGKSWNVPNSDPPAAAAAAAARRGMWSKSSVSGTVQARDAIDGFNPNPSPPAYKEMWFLGDTTDNVQSKEKAGEPAPFFISLLKSVNDTVGFPSLSRRQDQNTGSLNLSDILPLPDLEADGTPKPAVLLPNAVQQPVRLYDRGLATEHYGFYTYFKRTIFLKSVTVLNETTEGDVPLDEDGGCSETEANHLVTWAQTRMLVQIWTRKLDQNTTSLLTPNADGGINNSTELIRPGTMPYPVTVSLDTHGGDPNQKLVWEWPMSDRQQLSMNKAELLANNMAAGGTWINHRGNGDTKFGGFDGGTGGCKCEWVNWV